MAAGIGRGEYEISVQFFGGVDVHEDGLAVIFEHAAAVVVEHELGVD